MEVRRFLGPGGTARDAGQQQQNDDLDPAVHWLILLLFLRRCKELARPGRAGRAGKDVEQVGMPLLSRRLRELDRRVLREPDLATQEGWVKMAGRWKYLLASAVFTGGVIILGLALGSGLLVAGLVPATVLTAFQAGRMHREHELLSGKTTFMGSQRPPGL